MLEALMNLFGSAGPASTLGNAHMASASASPAGGMEGILGKLQGMGDKIDPRMLQMMAQNQAPSLPQMPMQPMQSMQRRSALSMPYTYAPRS